MAKSKTIPQTQAQPRHRKRQADQEQVTRMLLIGGVVAVLLVVAGIIAFGWYQTEIKPLGKTVLTVGEVDYSLGHLERRMDNMRGQGSFYQGQNLLLLADDTMDQLTTEAKILQSAEELNLSVTDEEFAAEIKDRGGVSEDAEPDVYATAYDQQIDESGLHEDEFVQMVKAELLQTKLFDYFKFGTPASEAQITANYLLLPDEASAEEAATRWRAGEDYKAIGEDIADAQSGELEWSPRGGSAFLPSEVEDYLFDGAAVGQVGDPVAASSVYYVAMVTDKDPNRALDDRGREIVAQRGLQEWIDGLNLTVEEKLSQDDENRALEDIL